MSHVAIQPILDGLDDTCMHTRACARVCVCASVGLPLIVNKNCAHTKQDLSSVFLQHTHTHTHFLFLLLPV